MMFHAKALELLSQCYQNVDDMDDEHDLEVLGWWLYIVGGCKNRATLFCAITSVFLDKF